jgi:peptidoglycan/xylan/chitin deacetylase (PgdA/CDA1 family)
MPKRKMVKKKRSKILLKKSLFFPILLFNFLLLLVFFLILNFYFVFFNPGNVKVLSSSIVNSRTVSSFQRSLVFKFSGRVDRSMIEQTFKVYPQVLGVMTWKGNEMNFQLEEPLKGKTKYAVEFAYVASPLPFFPTTTPEIYNLQFETGEAPKILSSSPYDHQKDVLTNKYLIFNFDRQLKTGNLENYFLIKPKIEGKLYVQNDRLIFIPKFKLQKDTDYFVGILKGLAASNNQQLIDDYFVNFKTVDGVVSSNLEKHFARVPILMYHNVGIWNLFDSKLTKRFKIEPKVLEEHLKYISKHFHTISMQELYDNLTNGFALPSNPIVLTFDDGWRGVYTDAYPILKKYDLKFTAYLISSYLDHNSGYLTIDQVRTMLLSRLLELGNHTVDHALLGYFGKDISAREIGGAENQLENYFGIHSFTFAYPGGSYNKNVIDEVEGAGFKTAVTVSAGNEQSEDQILLLKRTEIDGTDTVTDLERKLKM